MTIRGYRFALVVALSLVAAPSVSAQLPVPSSASKVSLQERLNRVRTDLFSSSPHVEDDVRELKQILGLEPRSAEGHVLLGIAYRGLGTQEMLAEAIAELRQAI